MYPDDYRYSEEHEWVAADGNNYRLGITDFAQEELGEVVYVELPDEGAEFGAEDEIGTVESVKAVAEIYTPIAGRVVAINELLVEQPELLNEDPHGEGWLVEIEPDDDASVDHLMDAEAYQAFIEG